MSFQASSNLSVYQDMKQESGIDYQILYEMLTYMRPAGSNAEEEFIERYIDSIPGMESDPFGNRILSLGESKTLFSAHTDTVHGTSGKQKIVVDEVQGLIYKDDTEPLGADDATGVFIMKHLIEAKVPGLYIFHRSEECGGLGSSYIADKHPDLLQGIDRAVAFDRKRGHSVITHQGWSRCCSETFAKTLAGQLCEGYKPDDSGVFTDTANYADIIPECTNLSVGYEYEHTRMETQCLVTLDNLIPIVQKVDWEALPTLRDPDAFDPDEKAWGSTTYQKGWTPKKPATANDYDYHDEDFIWENGIEDWAQAYQLVINDPCLAAALLERCFDYTEDADDEESTTTTVVYEDAEVDSYHHGGPDYDDEEDYQGWYTKRRQH